MRQDAESLSQGKVFVKETRVETTMDEELPYDVLVIVCGERNQNGES